MADIVLLIVLVAFFAVAVGFVRACDRIIGPDLELVAVVDETDQAEERAA